MKTTILIVLVALIIGACSSSNEPKDSEYYVYHSTPFEVIKVYGEGGAEIPKSQWDEEIIELYEEYNNAVQAMKLLKYKIDGDSLITKIANEQMSEKYEKRGDTLFVYSFSFEGFPTALEIDTRTLEFHYTSYRIEKQGFMMSQTGIEIGMYDTMVGDSTSFQEIKAGDKIAIFAGKFQYKK